MSLDRPRFPNALMHLKHVSVHRHGDNSSSRESRNDPHFKRFDATIKTSEKCIIQVSSNPVSILTSPNTKQQLHMQPLLLHKAPGRNKFCLLSNSLHCPVISVSFLSFPLTQIWSFLHDFYFFWLFWINIGLGFTW